MTNENLKPQQTAPEVNTSSSAGGKGLIPHPDIDERDIRDYEGDIGFTKQDNERVKKRKQTP